MQKLIVVEEPPENSYLREVREQDLLRLEEIENEAFVSDRLSRRQLKHWVKAPYRIFEVLEVEGSVEGYALVLLHRGTRLARLYSVAVSAQCQGRGYARKLLQVVESRAADKNRFFMRLEVAHSNEAAISLYQAIGYKVFGSLLDYYEDHQDALRMQKRIRHPSTNLVERLTPWYQQTTSFTCGPAALLMAMGGLNDTIALSQGHELDVWRESTTVFMTSGHGGCHPVGLALSARERGFGARVFLNTSEPLFISGVRDQTKKSVMRLVDEQFHERAGKRGVEVFASDFNQQDIARWLTQGLGVLVLISTYRMDGKKAPHWVTVSGVDDACFYVHDPDPEEGKQDPLDCQYMPIAREDFHSMSTFGKERLRACVVLSLSA